MKSASSTEEVATHTPATPLPWSAAGNPPAGYGWVIAGPRVHYLSGQYHGQVQDAKYIAHAANAYPKLVETLRKCQCGDFYQEARDLLAELGEAS